MKNCPSCSTECNDAVEVCPSCGFQFDEPTEPGSKRTMMGFPSLSAGDEEAEKADSDDPLKQTLFGFPAQEGESNGDDEDLAEESEDLEDSGEYAATHVLDPGDLDFPESPGDGDDLRGTVAGMPLENRDEEGDDVETDVVSGTAVFPGNQKPEGGAQEEDLRAKGTLMGMSLKEAAEEAEDETETSEEEGLRATQFAIPAAQASDEQDTPPGDGADLAEESDEAIDDAPTQAWSPGSLGLKDKSNPDDGRNKLLEKIRKSRPSSRETSKGIPGVKKKRPTSPGTKESPDLSALRKLRPKREFKATPVGISTDDRDTNEREPPPRRNQPDESTEKPRGSRPGKPPGGPGGYLQGREQKQGAEKESKALGAVSREPSEDESVSVAEGRGELGGSISDPEFGFAETGIASPDLLDEAGITGPKSGDSDELAYAETPPQSPATGDESSNPPKQGPGRSGTLLGTGTPVPQQPEATPRMPAGQRQHTPSGSGAQPSRQTPSGPQAHGGPPEAQAPGGPQAAGGQRPRPDDSRPTNNPPPQFGQPGNQRATPGVYETFDGSNSSPNQATPEQPVQARANARRGAATRQPIPEAAEDPLVRKIQTLFGILAGIIVLIVQGVVVLDGLPSGAGIVVVALAFTLGVTAIVGAALPIPSRTRSAALFGAAVLLFGSIVAGVAVSLPNTFLVVGLAGLVAIMAAAFPFVARFLL